MLKCMVEKYFKAIILAWVHFAQLLKEIWPSLSEQSRNLGKTNCKAVLNAPKYSNKQKYSNHFCVFFFHRKFKKVGSHWQKTWNLFNAALTHKTHNSFVWVFITCTVLKKRNSLPRKRARFFSCNRGQFFFGGGAVYSYRSSSCRAPTRIQWSKKEYTSRW